jgi:hypothetical protein
LEGKRQLVIDRLFNATDRPRLAITHTTVLDGSRRYQEV